MNGGRKDRGKGKTVEGRAWRRLWGREMALAWSWEGSPAPLAFTDFHKGRGPPVKKILSLSNGGLETDSYNPTQSAGKVVGVSSGYAMCGHRKDWGT